MTTRIIGAIVAVVLAIVGAVLLSSYVGSADERALAGTETTTVLVVRDGLSVPEGTPAEELADLVTEEAMPLKVVPADAVSSVSDLAGQVTSVELVAGEQVLSTRFIDPMALKPNAAIEVPEGMQELTILLEPQRVVGGQIQPGDTVGIFISLATDVGVEFPVTHLTLHKALVTNIQGLASSTEESDPVASSAPIPEGSVLVTLALTAPDAEKAVFGQEFGAIWLSKEPSTATEDGTGPVTKDEIFE